MKSAVFQVQGILNRRIKAGFLQYLVLWKGYTTSEATWQPISSLSSIKPLIDQYNKQHPDRSKPKSAIMKEKQAGKQILKQSRIDNRTSSSQLQAFKTKGDSFLAQPQKKQKIRNSKTYQPQHLLKKDQKKPNLYEIKLNEKLKKNGILKETAQNEIQTAENTENETVEVLKIVFVCSQNKKMFETRINSSIILLQVQKLKHMYPTALCSFYEKMFRFDP